MKITKYILLTFLACLFIENGFAQNFPKGISYQAIARDSDGNPIANTDMLIYFGLLESTATGNMVYQETHTVATNEFGWYKAIIGQGSVTPNGSLDNIDNVDWGSDLYFLELGMQIFGEPNPQFLGAEQLFSVPYAMYSQNTLQEFSMGDLTDVNLSSLNEGDILSWDGTNWIPQTLETVLDSVLYAINSNQSIYADTASFAYSVVFADTAQYAYNAGVAQTANSSNSSIYADTAAVSIYALTTENAWNLTGNTINEEEHFVGTTNDADLVFKTESTERMRITKNGDVGIGTNNPSVLLHVEGNDGMLIEGPMGQGSIPLSGEASRLMFYTGKAAMRNGFVTGSQWDNNNTGLYSYAGGYNAIARGDYSFTHGDQCEANGDASAAFGWRAKSIGYASFAVGPQSESHGFASIAMGRRCEAMDTASVALGYQNVSEGKAAIAFGYQAYSTADYSTAIGYKAHAIHEGSFIWRSTGSPQTAGYTTAPNQFMAIADGGFVFYTDIDLNSGVTLETGGGAWNTISDRNKKENFLTVDGQMVLNKINAMPVSSWNYKTQDKSIRHIGPMAQDFYAAFGLGSSDKTITTTDIDGVNLAAIKELAILTESLQQKTSELENMTKDFAQLETEKQDLLKRLERLEKLVANLETDSATTTKK